MTLVLYNAELDELNSYDHLQDDWLNNYYLNLWISWGWEVIGEL